MLLAGVDHSLQLERGELDLFYHVRWEFQIKPDLRWLHAGQRTLGGGGQDSGGKGEKEKAGKGGDRGEDDVHRGVK